MKWLTCKNWKETAWKYFRSIKFQEKNFTFHDNFLVKSKTNYKIQFSKPKGILLKAGVVLFADGLCRFKVLYTLPRAVWYFPGTRGGDEVELTQIYRNHILKCFMKVRPGHSELLTDFRLVLTGQSTGYSLPH